MLKNGDSAPDFTLENSEKEKITLSQYQGENVVLLFFPFAFTGVCTAEMCSMRDDITTYQNLNARVLAISVDSPFTLGKWKEELQIPFQLLSDFNKEVCPKYGASYEAFRGYMKGVAKRSAFVIDRKGMIRYAEVLEDAGSIPNFQSVRDTLASLN